MMPPLYEEIANLANGFEGTFARGLQLDAFRELLTGLDKIRPKIMAKISAESHGQSDEAAKWFAITVYAIKGGQPRQTLRHGWSARGLHRALRNAKAFDDERKFDSVLIEFTENGHSWFMPHHLWLLTLELGRNVDDLSPLRAWCRDYMKDWE
ncbi:hypothetical protein E0J20_09420 [Rhizobium leguminosarum bv. viciae]|nr:hypothetical protein E0J20_09420 [Rhizobium leguminosarum bv. viciae]